MEAAVSYTQIAFILRGRLFLSERESARDK